MNYKKFITAALKETNTRPTKNEMQFAYIVLYCGMGLSIAESINESLSLTKELV